jgi:Cd2+/Zn2+-exporting ATPase/Cu+-exporting ATPase
MPYKATIVDLPDLRLMVSRADEFPSGLQAAWDRLESRLSSLNGRKFYGVSRYEGSQLAYFAGVEPASDEEVAALGLPTMMIKGGKYLELLDKADVLLIDKTGTMTLGRPEIIDFRLLLNEAPSSPGVESNSQEQKSKILHLAASAERYSEHPLAEAVRAVVHQQGLELEEPEDFEAVPGLGVRARVAGSRVEVGSLRMFDGYVSQISNLSTIVEQLEAEGKTLLLVALDGRLTALLAATDTLRLEVPQAIQEVRALGIQEV